MDIYQIIITHNRSWTIREIIAFAVVFLMAVFLAAVLLRLHKIVIIQAVCGLLLLTFLSIVFGSTVFTRTPGIRQYQPEVFWSWKEILGIGTCGRLGSTTGDGLLQENLLNILLLFRFQQCIQGFLFHMIIVQCHGKRRSKAAKLAFTQYLRLDTVQRKGNGIPYFIVCL